MVESVVLRCRQMVRKTRNSRLTRVCLMIYSLASKHPAHLRHVGMTLAKRAPVPSMPSGWQGPSSGLRLTGSGMGRVHCRARSWACYDMAGIIEKQRCPIGNHGNGSTSLKEGWRLDGLLWMLLAQMRSPARVREGRGCLRQRRKRRLDVRTPARRARWLDTWIPPALKRARGRSDSWREHGWWMRE
jgi:hypothetical protein